VSIITTPNSAKEGALYLDFSFCFGTPIVYLKLPVSKSSSIWDPAV